MSQEYDNTNKGAAFTPFPDMSLIAQGKLDYRGREARCVVVMQKIGRDSPPTPVLYREVGPLFTNDKRGNDRAPDRSGPADALEPGWRVAAWKRDGQRGQFLSLSLSPPRNENEPNPDIYREEREREQRELGAQLDDEIPF
jgi:hypothetical protein